jgi:DNA-binding transcriptional MerR regulator
MFKIGEFSKLSNISVRSLRHYESLGLLSPMKTDRFTGYRYYSADQLDAANKIRMLREVGFSLDSIKSFLRAGNLDGARQYYELRQMEVEEELQSLRAKRDMLKLLLGDIAENENVNCYNVVEKDVPEKIVLRSHRILPSYDCVKEFWQEFLEEAKKADIQLQEPLFLRSLCLDKEYKETNVEVELQIEATGNSELKDGGQIAATPAAHVATVTFSGGCLQGSIMRHAVRRSLARWLEVNRKSTFGVMFNIRKPLNGDGSMFSTQNLLNSDCPDPDHWINEWGFEITKTDGG